MLQRMSTHFSLAFLNSLISNTERYIWQTNFFITSLQKSIFQWL